MSLECDLVTSPRHNQAQSGNHTPLKWLTERYPLSILSVLCLHLLYKPKSWGSAKILKNVDNYEWVTCSERWGQAPEVSIIVHGHCEILIKSRYYWYLKLELKMHPVPNTSWIGKNIFLLKKNSRIEMPNRFEDNHLCWNKARRSPAFWAGLSELWSHFVRWGAGCECR